MEYLHIEQSDNADRVVCNDACVFQPGGGSTVGLQRRRIAVCRQLDDSAARPELVVRFCRSVDPNLSYRRCISSAVFSVSPFRASTSLLLVRMSSRCCANCSFIYADSHLRSLNLANFASNSLSISAWSSRISVVRPDFSSRAAVSCF